MKFEDLSIGQAFYGAAKCEPSNWYCYQIVEKTPEKIEVMVIDDNAEVTGKRSTIGFTFYKNELHWDQFVLGMCICPIVDITYSDMTGVKICTCPVRALMCLGCQCGGA